MKGVFCLVFFLTIQSWSAPEDCNEIGILQVIVFLTELVEGEGLSTKVAKWNQASDDEGM